MVKLRRNILRTGSSRSKVTVSSLRWRLILYCQGQLFCFDGFLSANGQTRRMGRVRQGSSLTWLSIRIRLQRRKPVESNKLFDLFFSHQQIRSIRPIRSIRVRIETSRGQAVYLCLSPCASTARGFYCFCLMTQIGVQEVQKVQLVQIRSIRPIRGRKEIKSTAVCPVII